MLTKLVANIDKIDPHIIKFILVGVLNTIFGYSVYWVLLQIGLHFSLAALLATSLGVLFNYQTTGKLVFKAKGNSFLIKFILVYVILYVINVAGLKGLNMLGVGFKVGGLIMIIPLAALGFTLNKKLVFKP
jgi:putative flippase GtrA